MNIILCGLPRCGKTTVGKALAASLKWAFIDTDMCIEKAYQEGTGKKNSCREIYTFEGEAYFRELESQQIAALGSVTSHVISLGGGARVQPLGCVVYLKVPLETVWERLIDEDLPAFLDRQSPRESFEEVAKKRIPVYEKSAHFIVEVGNMPVSEIVQTIRKEASL